MDRGKVAALRRKECLYGSHLAKVGEATVGTR